MNAEKEYSTTTTGIIERARSYAPSFGQNIELQMDRSEAASAISAP